MACVCVCVCVCVCCVWKKKDLDPAGRFLTPPLRQVRTSGHGGSAGSERHSVTTPVFFWGDRPGGTFLGCTLVLFVVFGVGFFAAAPILLRSLARSLARRKSAGLATSTCVACVSKTTGQARRARERIGMFLRLPLVWVVTEVVRVARGIFHIFPPLFGREVGCFGPPRSG